MMVTFAQKKYFFTTVLTNRAKVSFKNHSEGVLRTKIRPYMTNEDIIKALGNVQEPDLGKDIVTLNMVKDIIIEGNYVSFTVVLTTPACPLKDLIKNNCIKAIKNLVNENAVVNVKFISN